MLDLILFDMTWYERKLVISYFLGCETEQKYMTEEIRRNFLHIWHKIDISNNIFMCHVCKWLVILIMLQLFPRNVGNYWHFNCNYLHFGHENLYSFLFLLILQGVLQDVKLIASAQGYIAQCPNMGRSCPTCAEYHTMVETITSLENRLHQMEMKVCRN